MITFKNFLLENYETKTIEDLVAIIEKDCDDFLKESKRSNVMIRGIETLGPPLFVVDGAGSRVYKKSTYKQRWSKDMDSKNHEAIDSFLDKKLGFKARSEHVMFAYGLTIGGSQSIADGEYGRAHIVFPIGPIKYAWSPKINDLYTHLSYGITTKPGAPKDIDEVLESLDYTNKNLSDALTSNSEIMMQCKEYYVLGLDLATPLCNALGIK